MHNRRQGSEAARRERLETLTRVARVYRGWTSARLNEALGRDYARIIPPSGNPKLDLVARLAEALEWEIGDLAEGVWASGEPDRSDPAGLTLAELDLRAQTEHRAGDFAAMESTARAMGACAASPRERAIAANRLAGALDGVGRYGRVLEVVREALAEPAIGADVRLMLTVNLANANYTLWNLHEARSIAVGVLESLDASPPRLRIERVAEAFGHALVGHATRRMLGRCEPGSEQRQLAERAVHELGQAADLYSRLFGEFGDAQYDALAHTARGGLVESRVAMGDLAPDEALDEVFEELDAFTDLDAAPSLQRIESAGWWAVFGANIAMRAYGGEAAFAEGGPGERTIAVCTNKAVEVGERLEHWPMRERAFTLEWFRRQTVGRIDPGLCASWTLDAEDLRVLVGAMGRFPYFRRTGWAILGSATIEGA